MKILITLIFFIFKGPLSASSEAPKSDFLNLCKVSFEHNAEASKFCETLSLKLFRQVTTLEIIPVTPETVGASSAEIDKKIQFLIFNDPNAVAGIAYCYFVFKNWISPKTMSPDSFVSNASGFSILNEDILAYKKWLSNTSDGIACTKKTKEESGVNVSNLEPILKNKTAVIGLNPYASLKQFGMDSDKILNEMKVTINHERTHAFQVECREFENWSIKAWEKTTTKEKQEYIKKYPSYNWMIPKIAGREYIAFLYENTPEKIREHLGKCKFMQQ